MLKIFTNAFRASKEERYNEKIDLLARQIKREADFEELARSERFVPMDAEECLQVYTPSDKACKKQKLKHKCKNK